MMAKYIRELTDGMRVDATVVLRAKDLNVARNGDAYLSMELTDRSGSMRGVLFRPSCEAVAIPAGTIIRVEGTIATYRGSRRISVRNVMPTSNWSAQDLMASGSVPLTELQSEFRSLVASVGSPELRKLLRMVFSDKEFSVRFRGCPATESDHHVHLHGLLEHTTSVARMCDLLSARNDSVDRDVLVTAALLHDIGVADELEPGPVACRTEQGRLLGHVVLGDRRVRDAARKVDGDPQRLLRVQHAVLSHHDDGTSSVAMPTTLEGLILQHADRLDADVDRFEVSIASAFKAGSNWTVSSGVLQRELIGPSRMRAEMTSAGVDASSELRMTA